MRRDSSEVAPVLASAPLPATPAQVIDALRAFVSVERMARIDSVLATRTRRLVIVLDKTTDPHNAAAVLRSADAFGVQEIAVITSEESFTAPRKVAQGTAHWLDLTYYDSAAACAAALHRRGYQILIAAMDGDVTPSRLREVPRAAVVFGNEHLGVSEEMRALADGTFTIPMTGFVESLNVSVAAAITMHAATVDRAGDLGADDQLALRARFMLSSVSRAEEIVSEVLQRRALAE